MSPPHPTPSAHHHNMSPRPRAAGTGNQQHNMFWLSPMNPSPAHQVPSGIRRFVDCLGNSHCCQPIGISMECKINKKVMCPRKIGTPESIIIAQTASIMFICRHAIYFSPPAFQPSLPPNRNSLEGEGVTSPPAHHHHPPNTMSKCKSPKHQLLFPKSQPPLEPAQLT